MYSLLCFLDEVDGDKKKLQNLLKLSLQIRRKYFWYNCDLSCLVDSSNKSNILYADMIKSTKCSLDKEKVCTCVLFEVPESRSF